MWQSLIQLFVTLLSGAFVIWFINKLYNQNKKSAVSVKGKRERISRYTSANISKTYLGEVIQILIDDGFDVTQSVTYKTKVFDYVARRKTFELQKGGFADRYFIFCCFSSPDIRMLRDFSVQSYKYAVSSSGFHPPRGLGYGLFCFPVAVADFVDDKTVKAIYNRQPPAHWAAFEMLAVVSLKQKEVYYNKWIPAWGGLFYPELKQTIIDVLTPSN